MRNLIAAGAVAAVVGLVLTGCSGAPTTGSGDSNGAAPTNKLLGIVSITANEANNAAVIAAATKEAKSQGWKVQVVDAEGSADTANSAIRNFVNEKAGMIFDLVFPASSIGAGLSAARAAHIPVASWGGGPGDGIVVNDGDGGPFADPATKLMLQDMGNSGSVLALTYRGGQVCRDRETVFDADTKGVSGVKITKEQVNVPGFQQDAAKYATAWLAANPKGSANLAIWGCWDDPVLGAVSALKQAGRTDVKSYGINGGVAAIKAVEDGSLTATIYEDCATEGKTLFETTLKAIQAGASWKPQTINVPGVVVTKDNVAQFLQQHPGADK